MQLHNLKRNKSNRKAKQVGRGGTRGKTSGRGTKGQSARAGRKKRPEMRDFIKRIPKLRGRGRNSMKSVSSDSVPVNLSALEAKYSAGETVDMVSLLEKKIVNKKGGKLPKVKILGGGSLSKKLTVQGIPLSAGAKEAIEKLGGKVV